MACASSCDYLATIIHCTARGEYAGEDQARYVVSAHGTRRAAASRCCGLRAAGRQKREPDPTVLLRLCFERLGPWCEKLSGRLGDQLVRGRCPKPIRSVDLEIPRTRADLSCGTGVCSSASPTATFLLAFTPYTSACCPTSKNWWIICCRGESGAHVRRLLRTTLARNSFNCWRRCPRG